MLETVDVRCVWDLSVSNQFFHSGSRVGALLDMLTDRCATLCLQMVLCVFYPSWMLFFQLSAALDIASHWIHMHRLEAFLFLMRFIIYLVIIALAMKKKV